MYSEVLPYWGDCIDCVIQDEKNGWKKSLIRWNWLGWTFVYLCEYCLIVHEIELLNKQTNINWVTQERELIRDHKNNFVSNI